MLKVMVVEVEQPQLDLIVTAIEQNEDYLIVGAFTNPNEASEQFHVLQPDIMFLSIETPKIVGLELAKKLESHPTKIIFTTTYPQDALDVFKVNTVAYLINSVTQENINKVVSRLVKNHISLEKGEMNKQQLTIYCFGTFEIKDQDDVVLKWPTKRTEELFAYFLIYPNQVIYKWILADLFWPEMEEKRSMNNLYNTIYRLKRTFKEYNIDLDIRQMNDGYILEKVGLLSDYETFRLFFSDQLQVTNENVEKYEQIFSLYKGPLFGTKDYMWSICIQEKLAKQYALLTDLLVTYYTAQSQYDAVELILKKFLSFYPLHIDMNVMLIQLYDREGKMDRVIEHYKQFERLLNEEFDVTPPAICVGLYEKWMLLKCKRKARDRFNHVPQ